jgi:hypothetical protein
MLQLSLVLGPEVCPYFRDLAWLEVKIIIRARPPVTMVAKTASIAVGGSL